MLKAISSTVLGFCFVVLFSSAALGDKTIKIQTNAVCGMCKDRIESTLGALEGVESVRLDLTTKKVKIKFDDAKQSEASLRLAITKLGYAAEALAPDAEAQKALPACCKSDDGGGMGCHEG